MACCSPVFRGKITKLAGILKRTVDSIYAEWDQSEILYLIILINIIVNRQSFWPGTVLTGCFRVKLLNFFIYVWEQTQMFIFRLISFTVYSIYVTILVSPPTHQRN